MRFALTTADGQQKFELRHGSTMVVGRAPTSDIPVFDPTISRKHAEVDITTTGIRVRDAGSSNGTFINGTRLEANQSSGLLSVGDNVTFGKVAFRLIEVAPPPPPPPPVAAPSGGAATIVRQLPIKGTSLNLSAVRGGALGTLGGAPQVASATPAAIDKNQQKLETLIEVLKGLTQTKDLDALLEKIAGYAYEVLAVDRVAILLVNDQKELVPRIARDKRGSDATRAVSQTIARKALDTKMAILSDNAADDSRFGGQSILMQQIRSAVCCPLLGADESDLGVLYVDNVTTTHRFSEEDFEFCIAFAGIAAVAIENTKLGERILQEKLVRGNFERYFTPALAERIASAPDAAKLGGEKRPVAVLFSDIRGFTSLSETMAPDAMANLLTEYFTDMVDCVFRHEGTLDKFIGDAVMAQWGAPLGGPDDADKAMTAALEMIHQLDALNAKWRSEGRPELQIGIGLNFGDAFAGNIGSQRRMEFTVIGDTVNTASRLCGAAGPREILISDAMRMKLTSPPPLAVCPPMELKNKSQPVAVYRVVW